MKNNYAPLQPSSKLQRGQHAEAGKVNYFCIFEQEKNLSKICMLFDPFCGKLAGEKTKVVAILLHCCIVPYVRHAIAVHVLQLRWAHTVHTDCRCPYSPY